MYCTPCARLMKSITPNTSASPAAIRNSSTPSWSPLRVCTRRRAADIFFLLPPPLSFPSPSPPSSGGEGEARRAGRGQALPASPSLHLAILGVRVALVREHLLDDLGLELAVGSLGDLDEVEVLDRIVVGVELEAAAQRLEVGLGERGTQRVLVCRA